MKTQLFRNKARSGNNTDGSKLSAIVASIQSSLNHSGTSFATKALAGAAMSMESIDSSLAIELGTCVDGLHTSLEHIAKEHHIEGTTTSAQLAAAAAAGVIASDIPGFLSAPIKREVVANESMGFVSPMGNNDYQDTRMRQALEAYDERENKNAVVYSVAYNLQAARQDEFGETLFPTIVVTPDQVGFCVSIRLVMVMQEVRRQISGAVDQFGKRNIIQAVIDPTILKNDMLKIVPVYNDDSKDKFVPIADLAPRDILNEGEQITTSALAMGKTFSLLGISQTDSLLETGLQDSTDSIDTALTLQTLYMKATVGAVSEVLKFNVSRLQTATFNYAVQGNYRQMNLAFETTTLKVDKDVMQATGAASVLFDPIKTGKYTVRLGVKVSGSVNIELGNTSLFASNVEVLRVTDETGVDLALDAGPGKTIADLFAAATMFGFDLDARRTNLNRRQRGQLLDTTYYNQVYAVPLRSPITIPRPLTASDANDSSDLAALITATHIRTSNAAVDELLRVSALLREYTSSIDTMADTPEILGVSRFLVKPTFESASLHVPDEVDSLKSFERVNDVQALLVNKMRDIVYRMYLTSNYKAAADALAGGVAPKPTVIVATDPYIAAYLMVSGDFRTFGNEFNVKVVSTQNMLMRGKLFMTFGDFTGGTEGVPNPMHFGNMAWKPELTLVLPLHRNGANSKELTVQPSFIHITNLPILAELSITGISEAVASKVVILMEAPAP